MTSEQKVFLLDHLARSQSELETALAGVDSSAWTLQPCSGEWSIAQCAEHIVTVESRVAQRMRGLGEIAVEDFDKEDSARKDKLVLMALDRQTKMKAPVALEPSNLYESSDEMLKDFRRSHEQLIQTVQESPALLRGRFADHPVFKKLDGYQWILVCSCHTMRHTLRRLKKLKHLLNVA